MSDQNKAAFVAICNIFNTGDLSNVEALFASDFLEHDVPPGINQGLVGFKQLVAMSRAAFSNLRLTVDQILAEGDLVAGRLVATGLHTGAFMGIAATGRSFNIQEFHMCRFAHGKCVEHWGLADMMKMMRQLGVSPASAA